MSAINRTERCPLVGSSIWDKFLGCLGDVEAEEHLKSFPFQIYRQQAVTLSF